MTYNNLNEMNKHYIDKQAILIIQKKNIVQNRRLQSTKHCLFDNIYLFSTSENNQNKIFRGQIFWKVSMINIFLY